MIRQVGKFLLVGITAAGIEFSGFLLLFYFAHSPLWLANGTSFLMGLVTSFALNRQWTFFSGGSNEYNKKAHHQFVLYFALALVNLLVVLWVVQLLVALTLPPPVAKIFAMGLIAVWNFALYRTVIFRNAG